MIPRVETQRSAQVSDMPTNPEDNPDMIVNNLVYVQPKALSLRTNRTYKKELAQRSNYPSAGPGTTIVFDWNSGSDYVDCADSYLYFKLNLESTNTQSACNFGTGSAMNCFSETRVRSRSGTELARQEQANLFAKVFNNYMYGTEYFITNAQAAGYSPNQETTDPSSVGVPGATFCIPLSYLSGFFRPCSADMLLPPQLASGLRVELDVEDFRNALFLKGGPNDAITGYTISNPYMHLSCVSMTDDTQRAVNQESASNGLEYTYQQVFASINTLNSGETKLSQQIYKAVSQAEQAVAVPVDTGDLLDILKDSIRPAFIAIKTWQWRLGSLYFPNQAVQLSGGLSTAVDMRESYMLTLQAFNRLRHTSINANSVTYQRYLRDAYAVATSFERDASLDLSGMPSNNSRSIELNATLNASQSTPTRFVTFLMYCSVAKAYIDNTAVAI